MCVKLKLCPRCPNVVFLSSSYTVEECFITPEKITERAAVSHQMMYFSNEVPQESIAAMHLANKFINILEVNDKKFK